MSQIKLAILSGSLPVLLAVIVVILSVAHLAEGTFFIIGEACLASLTAATTLLNLEEFQLDEDLNVVRGFCSAFVHHSIGGVLLRQVRDLIRFVADGSITGANAPAEFASLIGQLSFEIVASGN